MFAFETNFFAIRIEGQCKKNLLQPLKLLAWLYLARRSDRQGAPVLIWPCHTKRWLPSEVISKALYVKGQIQDSKTYCGQTDCQISYERILSLTTTRTQADYNQKLYKAAIRVLMQQQNNMHTSCGWSSHPSQHASTSSLPLYSQSQIQFG
jgi:hypothetical protein